MAKLKRDQERGRQTERSQRGANLVEFALVLFILALFLMGAVDFGRAFHTYITITNAAREGARRASRFPDKEESIRQAVRQEAANNGLDFSEDNALITVGRASDWSGGNPISVTVDYTFTTFIGGLIGLPELHLRSDTEMVIFGYTD